MRTVYSDLLPFASISDGIAQGDGFLFFGLGFIVGTDDKSGSGHTRRIYELMGIGKAIFVKAGFASCPSDPEIRVRDKILHAV